MPGPKKLSIFSGNPANPVGESVKKCCRAYMKFAEDFPNYDVDVTLCVFNASELPTAQAGVDKYFENRK